MKYFISTIILIILTSLSHIVYKISGANFYITYICGGVAGLIFGGIFDWERLKSKIK